MTLPERVNATAQRSTGHSVTSSSTDKWSNKNAKAACFPPHMSSGLGLIQSSLSEKS